MSKHPIQPLETDEHGVLRFKANAIVRYLLDHGGIDLNKIATIDFPADDREQFAQLIGYSLSGFGDLSYVSDETYAAAEAMSNDKDMVSSAAREKAKDETLEAARKAVRDAAVALFRIHPDDLHI